MVKIEGIDKQKFQEFIPVKVDEETLQRFRDAPDGALLGRDFLEKYEGEYPWELGQTYKLRQLGGVSINFVGSFESDNEVYNTIILAGRRYLQEVDDRLGVAHQVYVRLDDASYVDQVSKAIDAKVPEAFPYKTTTKDQRSFMAAAVEDLRQMVKLSHLVMAITLCVVLISVANTISMATRDRVQEFGIIRSLGFQRGHLLGMVLGESVLLGLLGGVLGLLVAVFLLNFQDHYYGVLGLNLLIRVTPQVATLAIVISLVVGIVGGLLPAIGASRLQIVSSLRNVD